MIKRVLITGAAGRVGAVLRTALRGVYPVLRLSDWAPLGAVQPGEEIVPADLGDPAAVLDACRDCDVVVHLGGQAVEADWPTVCAANIEGAFNLFEASRLAGVRRVVFASSHHAIGFHRRDRRLDAAAPPRPDSRYGVSKVFGEALGRLYADKHGLDVICIRIGSLRSEPEGVRGLSVWVSPRDMAQLVRRCIDAPPLHFSIVYGVSANHRRWWDDPLAGRIGYRPEDDAEAWAAARLAGPTEDPIEVQFQGGKYAGLEFDGDPDRID